MIWSHKRQRSVARSGLRGLSLACLLLLAGPASAQTKAEQAQTNSSARFDCTGLYERGEYPAAAACFGELEAMGAPTGHLAYNQGNAWMRAGDTGRAVHAYRRAQLFLPRDGDLLANLATAQERSKDALGQVDARSPLAKALLAPYDALSATELLLLGSVFWALFFLSYAWQIRQGRLRPGTLLLSTLFLALLGLGSYAVRTYEVQVHPIAVVLDEEVTLRSGRDLRSVDLARLHAGAEARIVEEAGRWVQVRLADGQRGWLPWSSLAPVRPEVESNRVLP